MYVTQNELIIIVEMIDILNLDFDSIKKIYKENFNELQITFNKGQGVFLNDIYKRYGNDLDCAVIILHYAKNLHRQILRKREADLNYDISFESFWKNHSLIQQKKFKIIEISKSTGLPKETARRKIDKLLKIRMLKKNKNILFWEPTPHDKNSYDLIINKHMDILINLINSISKFLDFKLNQDLIKKKILKNFSFYWLHYLNTQLEYLRIWQSKFNDLELLMIFTEFEIQKHIINQNHNISNIRVGSVSDVTGLPRATTFRKISKLSKMKIINKDLLSDKFNKSTNNFLFKNINNYVNMKNITNESIENFSNFYTIILRALYS